MKINLFKIREGKLQQWKDWCNLLNTKFKKEAIETLKEEEVSYESFSVFSVGGVDYAIGMAEGEMLPANTERELNSRHNEVKKECLDRIESPEMLYEMYNPSQ